MLDREASSVRRAVSPRNPGRERLGLLVADALETAELSWGATACYQEGATEVRLADHLADVRLMATGLRRAVDIAPGRRVAVLAQTSLDYVGLYHAAMLGYFVIVPLNTRLAVPELEAILHHADADILIHDALHQDVARRLCETLAIPALDMRQIPRSPVAEPPLPAPVEGDPVMIQYTGGTSGRAKGVVFAQRGMAVVMHRLQFLWDCFSPGTTLYASTALFHVSGINTVMGPVFSGARTVLVPTFDIAQLIADSKRYRVTHFVLIALMIDRFLDGIEHEADQHQHIRHIAYGGAPVSAALIARMRRLLPNARLGQCYGMTEALGSLTLLTDDDHRRGGRLLQSAGRALPGCAVLPMRSDGTPCDANEAGELFARCDTLMSGYWRDEATTAAVLQDGFYRTGDIGYLDEEGYLYVVDRAKDMIVTGGENVYSIEVERAIETLPGVLQVAVIGIPSDEWGEQVHAIIVTERQSGVTQDTVREWLKDRIAGYKQPKSIDLREEPLPVSGNNKVVKAELRKPFWQNRDRAVN